MGRKASQELDALAAEFGFVYERTTGSKHRRYRHPSGAFVVLHSTASDHRAMANSRKWLKRALGSGPRELTDQA